MIRNILQLLFCVLPFALPLALYKCRRPFMATFYHAMTRSAKARKLYVQVLLILLLLFHYVYTVGHPGEFGVLPSTALCAVLFSFKRADRWLRALCDRSRAFGTLSLVALAIGFMPHLYMTAVTAAYLLLAALFYPSVRVMTECSDTSRIPDLRKHPGLLTERYHDHHHAKLPHDADSGNPDISAQ